MTYRTRLLFCAHDPRKMKKKKKTVKVLRCRKPQYSLLLSHIHQHKVPKSSTGPRFALQRKRKTKKKVRSAALFVLILCSKRLLLGRMIVLCTQKRKYRDKRETKKPTKISISTLTFKQVIFARLFKRRSKASAYTSLQKTDSQKQTDKKKLRADLILCA